MGEIKIRRESTLNFLESLHRHMGWSAGLMSPQGYYGHQSVMDKGTHTQ